jgi:uncharacterized protein (DUF1501 family)
MNKNNRNCSRREFLKAATLTAAVTQSGMPWFFNLSLAGTAAAQTANDYKAIVCVFLEGGNDSFNTILATDTPSWTQYRRWRDTGTIPTYLPPVGSDGGVLPITPKTSQSGRTFALHPNLSGLVDLFNQKRLAIVSNIGPIKGPVDLSNYQTGVEPYLPSALYSHSSQSAHWQAQTANGGFGWGGRMGDMLLSLNGSSTIFTSISTAGTSFFSSGLNTISYSAGPNGGVEINWLKNTASSQEKATANILKKIINKDSINLFEKETSAITRRSIESNSFLVSSILPSGDGGVQDPSLIPSLDGTKMEENPLASQLQTVARIIGGQSALGVKRQIFYVSLGAFDTHQNQKRDHNYGMLRLNHGLSYFDTVLGNLKGQNRRNQVTLFTASDFGRTFTANDTGTDHGFGGHHFVLGGSVAGGDIYGTFPQTGTGHERDMGKGILIPQYSVDQYAATIAKWFGLSDSQLNEVFPNLVRFSPRDLGFFV